MRAILALVLCASIAWGATKLICPNYPNYDLPMCAAHIFDANGDGNITHAEMEVGISVLISNFDGDYNPIVILNMFNHTTDHIFDICDLDGNGVLNMDDWNHENRTTELSTCLTTVESAMYACNLCRRTDWVPPPMPQAYIDSQMAIHDANMAEIASQSHMQSKYIDSKQIKENMAKKAQ